MTTFAEYQHPRATDGRFTAKGHAEAELELAAPAITLSEGIGDWGPRFHDMDTRPAYEYTPSERYGSTTRLPSDPRHAHGWPGGGREYPRILYL